MKIFLIPISILSTIFLLTDEVNAQIPAIDTLYLLPAQPEPGDSVSLVTCAIFPSGDCNVLTTAVNTNGSDITVDVYYTVGMATYICTTCDTIPLGTFSEGPHVLYLFSYYAPSLSPFDTENLSFSVNGTVSSGSMSDNFGIEVFPNPVQDALRIRNGENADAIFLYDLSGRLIPLEFYFADGCLQANMKNIENGLYILKIADADQNVFLYKIIRH